MALQKTFQDDARAIQLTDAYHRLTAVNLNLPRLDNPTPAVQWIVSVHKDKPASDGEKVYATIAMPSDPVRDYLLDTYGSWQGVVAHLRTLSVADMLVALYTWTKRHPYYSDATDV